MLTDVAPIVLALVAMRLAARPAKGHYSRLNRNFVRAASRGEATAPEPGTRTAPFLADNSLIVVCGERHDGLRRSEQQRPASPGKVSEQHYRSYGDGDR